MSLSQQLMYLQARISILKSRNKYNLPIIKHLNRRIRNIQSKLNTPIV